MHTSTPQKNSRPLSKENGLPLPQKPIFQGHFSLALRELLHAKRLSVGFSLQQLGEFLHIHWSTIRKWEAGITTSCHPRHIKRINKFLAGDFDEQIHSMLQPEQQHRPNAHRQLPPMLEQCLDRAGQAYQLCQTDCPDLGGNLLRAIDQLIQDTIREFLKRLGTFNDK